MNKKILNQNTFIFNSLLNHIESDFEFSNKSINRFNKILSQKDERKQSKLEELSKLIKKINSIENCKLKKNSNSLIVGDGNIFSPLMVIGETPGLEEDKSGLTYQGEDGNLLRKMFLAINVKLENMYKTYSVNFRPPDDRKPSSQEIKRYSFFLKEHIAIIDPKIIVLLGGSAMEALTGSSNKITDERGKWKEIILKNKSYPFIITYNPSYLIRYPEYKKYSWEDLKKIKIKIKDLKIQV